MPAPVSSPDDLAMAALFATHEHLADDETVPENLDGIARIVDYIGRKTGSSPE